MFLRGIYARYQNFDLADVQNNKGEANEVFSSTFTISAFDDRYNDHKSTLGQFCDLERRNHSDSTY
ncbi:hypothetical protein ACTXT7_014128 [Hymenolepis weldensis]